MSNTNNLSNYLNKVRKIWAEQGIIIVLRMALHFARKKYLPKSNKKIQLKRNSLMRALDFEVLKNDVKCLFSSGLFRPLEEVRSNLQSLPTELVKKTVNEADRLLENEFIIYGHLKLRYEVERFSWLLDPINGHVWPCDSYPLNVITQKPEGTDVKTIWEIARFQFLAILAYAYIFTGQNKYAYFAIDKVKSWIDENPFPNGPHWSRAMESSIRLINWCVYLPLLNVIDFSNSFFHEKLTESILEHLIFIRENLEVSPSYAGNHYLADLAGLLLGQFVFPSLDWASESTEFAEREFKQEILRQFKESGINFEGSLAYHRLSSEICLVGIALLKKNNRNIPKEIVERLKKIASFTKYYAEISEECPIIGDNDNGIFVKIFPGQESNRHQYIDYLSDCIIEDNDKAKNSHEFLCSIHFTDRFTSDRTDTQYNNENVKSKLKAMDFNGLVIARHKSEALFLNTLNACGGHTHNDKLSIYPVISNKLVFIDRGSFSYTGFKEKRHQDRMTSSHNGPVINGWEQSKIWKNDVFYMGGEAKCYNHIDFYGNVLVITGWHTGYERFKRDLKTFRKIKWDIRKQSILISDWVEGNHSNEFFQFTWKFLINPVWIGEIKDGVLQLTNAVQTVRFENTNGIDFTISMGTYCPSYQIELPCQTLNASYILKSYQKMNFLLHY